MTDDATFTRSPLNAGSRGLARDPAEIYEQRESRTCAGCEHVSSTEIMGERRPICAKGRPYGRKCRLYAERR